jgi:hypothetical protein
MLGDAVNGIAGEELSSRALPVDDDWGVASHTLNLAWLAEPGLPWFTADSAMDCHGELRAE